MHKFSNKTLILSLAFVALVTIFSAYFRLNIANLLQMQGRSGASIQWLTPLIYINEPSTLMARVKRSLIVAQVADGQLLAASQNYAKANPKPHLPSNIAAKLLTSDFDFTDSDFAQLTLNAFLITNPLTLNFLTSNQPPAVKSNIRASAIWLSQINYAPACQSGDQRLQARAARLLNVVPVKVQLSQSLITDGDFVPSTIKSALPSGWSIANWIGGDYYSQAIFAVGIDQLDKSCQDTALRIDGVVYDFLQPNQKEDARGGAIHSPISLKKDVAYITTFVYRTNEDNVDAKLFLAPDAKIYSPELSLPPTNNACYRVTIIARNQTGSDAVITPLIRLWSLGTLWFDKLSIQEIYNARWLDLEKSLVDIRPCDDL